LLKDAKSRMPFSALGLPHAAKRFIDLLSSLGREAAPLTHHASLVMNIACLLLGTLSGCCAELTIAAALA
jgi:hypothetical protein